MSFIVAPVRKITRGTTVPVIDGGYWRVGNTDVPQWVSSLSNAYGINADTAALSIDPYAGRYFRDGGRKSVSDALSTSWSGGGFVIGASGNLESFGANEAPALSGVGISLYRHITPLLYYSADMSVGAYWTASNGSSVKNASAPDGTTNATTFTENTSNSFHGFVGNTGNRLAGAAGTKYTAYASVSKVQTRRYVILWWGSGTDGIIATLDTQTGTITECTVTGGDYTADECGVEDIGTAWRVWTTGSKATGYSGGVIIPLLRGTTASTGNGPAPSYVGDGSTIVAWDCNLVAADFVPPPNPTGASLTPRYATTVTDPDFASLVSAYGLDSGFKTGASVALDRLSDSAARCVWAAGADADNCARLDISPSNTAKFTLRKAASDVLVLESGAFTATGDKDIAVTAKDGAWTLTATGVAGDTDAGTYGLPTLSGFRYGSQFGDAAYLNGTMKNLVLGRAV